jgi:hypothetical protein
VLYDLDYDDLDSLDLHLHATMVMPAPIARANTCFQGNVAQWDFAGRDLFARGFEMRVLARAPE